MKTIVVTVWAYPNRPLHESPLKLSCDVLGIPLLVLQEGEPYENHYANKIVKLFEQLRQLDFDHLIFIDGDDAFLTEDPRPRAVAALRRVGVDFLLGAEHPCWPWTNRLAARFPKLARCNHPNSGVYAASKTAFVREFENMIAFAENDVEHYVECGRTLRNDDQALFAAWIATGRSGIRLDYCEDLVLNLNGLALSEIALQLDVMKLRTPPVIHGAGGSKKLAHRLFSRWKRIPDLKKEARYQPGVDHPANCVTGLLEMVRELPPLGRIVEVGSHLGVSTEAFALCSGCVLAVDPWDDEDVLQSFRRRMDPYRHVQALRMTSRAAAPLIADQSMDLVYIDGNHQYEAVRQDIELWLPKLRPGGFLAGHDYGPSDSVHGHGVSAAVTERFGQPHRLYPDLSWLVHV